MNELALFAGAGGGLLASRLLGFRTVAACEIDPWRRDILMQRQAEGHLDRFPIWDDICTLDASPFRDHIDIITGGFPCQDISASGRGAGLAGKRSGLWYEYLRVVAQVRPAMVFAENTSALRSRGLGEVIAGLAELGYDCRWCTLGAAHLGAYHRRDRMWILAYSNEVRLQEPGNGEAGKIEVPKVEWQSSRALDDLRRGSVSVVCRDHDDVADRMERLAAIGDGQVPVVAAAAFTLLSVGLDTDQETDDT